MHTQPIHAPRGSTLQCKGWAQEGALRCFMNNLDPEVAERPEDLVVYGGSGKAARNWKCFEAIVHSLKTLTKEQTLLIQSGKPVGIVPTHPDAPRVLIANSLLVPHWAHWDSFHRLEKMGLTMYGQMTAGSWIYIGTQGIIQGTYETFMEAGRQHFGGSLEGRVILSAGLGGMGGAQPLAASLAGAVGLFIEVDPTHIQRRLKQGFLDECAQNIDHARTLVEQYKKQKQARSIGLLGNAADLLPKLLQKGFDPDLVTDQTSAHDLLDGYIPQGLSLQEAAQLRKSNPTEYQKRALESIAIHVQALLGFQKKGAHVFDYGNNIRAQAQKAGVKNAFDFPGFVPAYIRPQFCEGRGPFRWVALSGDPQDIAITDQALLELFPKKKNLHRWLTLAQKRVPFQGLPSRICWLGYGEREKAGLLFHQLVKTGKVKAPIVIGRDHLDCGSVASPFRETEGMKDGSDAIADWPILNALVNAVNGASWVSVHHGGGVGIGYSIHAGMVIVVEGTEASEKKLSRVLNSDPGLGLIRHADAGYERAQTLVQTAWKKRGGASPMLDRSINNK